MCDQETMRLVQDFLGSAHVFASAVRDVMEKKLLTDIAGRELTFSQLKILKLVAFTETQTISDVAAFLGVSNAAASQMVDKMVRHKWLSRTEGKIDRRATELALTPGSRRLLAAYDRARAEKLGKIFRRLPLKKLRSAADLLESVAVGIVNHTANPEEVCLQCGIYFRDRCLLRSLSHRTCFYQRHRDRGAESWGAMAQHAAQPESSPRVGRQTAKPQPGPH